MNTLDSPVEALAFNYFGFDKVWTWWVSFLAAAVGFWRIKVPSLSPPPSKPCQTVFSASSSSPVERVPAAAERRPASGDEPFSMSEGVGGSTKGKFAAYFYCGDELGCGGNVDEAENDGSGGGGEGGVLVKESHESWGRVMKTRMGEMGWYRCQDITVIDGNVVRLWAGGGRRRSATAAVGVGCVVTTWQSSSGRHC